MIFISSVRFLNIFGGSCRVCGAVRRLLLPLLRHQASTAAAACAPRTAATRRQPQHRGQRRSGLNLSWGWHSKYCQARFFFTAFGAPSSLQFQALNIPQWTSLQCLVSSIYNYIFHPFLAFVFIWGLWYGLFDSFIIEEFTRMINHIRCRQGIKNIKSNCSKKVWHTDTFQLVADVKVIVVILRKSPRICSRIILHPR